MKSAKISPHNGFKEKGIRTGAKNYAKSRSTLELGLLAVPAILWFIVFAYIPMFGIIIAFKDFNYADGIFGSAWNGLENFRYLFATNDAFRILRNTVLYNIAFIVLGTVIPITVAMMLDRIKSRSFIKFAQTTMFLPHFISWVIVGFIAQRFFSTNTGLLNQIIEMFGGEKVSWYTEKLPWIFIIIIVRIWKVLGFNTIIYYGSIIGIDTSLYEAARIDGANEWQVARKITLPLLMPTIMILFIMATGNILRADFGLFYYVPNNQGPLYPVTDVIDTYIYRALKISGDIPGSSAASFVQSVAGLVIVYVANYVTKKIDPDNALF